MTRRNPRRRPPRAGGAGGAPRGITSLLRPHRKLMVYLLAGGLVLLQAISATFSGGTGAGDAPPTARGAVASATVDATPNDAANDAPSDTPSDTTRDTVSDTAAEPAAAEASAPPVEPANALPPPPAPSAAEPVAVDATHAWSDAAALVAAAAGGEAARSVRLQIDSDPPGATVLLAGTPVGRTPLDRPVSATGPTPYRIELAVAGGRRWAPLEGVLDLSADVRLEVRLWPR